MRATLTLPGTSSCQAHRPTPKKTPQQAASLGHASNAMAFAAATIGVAAIIVGVASGGVLVPVLFGLLAGGPATFFALHLSDLAIDPPDPDYMVTVVPPNIPLPRYGPSDGISVPAADALNALKALQEEEIGLAAAMVAALYKAQGAVAAGDAQWEETQTLAAADFAHRLAVALNSEPPLRSAARNALEAGGFPIFTVTAAEAAAARAAWDSSGLTPSQRHELTLGGARPGMEERLHAIVGASPPTLFVQQNVLDLLAPPTGGPALNQIEQANAEAAAALLDWSESLRLNPVGLPAPSPAIVTRVQPNQGVSAGGTTVTISGSSLLDTTQVNFGTTPASSGTCTSSECTVVSPPGTGTVNVTAIGPGGTSAVTAATRFTYVTSALGPVHLPAGTLVTSGGFDPPNAASVQSFESLVGAGGAAKLGPGWEIQAGSVDLVGPGAARAAEGIQFVDLNGNDAVGPGTISQVVTTLPGHNYRLSFRLAGNPNGDPVVKSLTASFGTKSQPFTFDTSGPTNLDLGWVEKTVDIVSCSPTERVTLQTTTTGQRGPNIDAVSVVDLGLAPAGTCAAQTATFTHYLAEGATGDFFDMQIALLNPSATTAATVTLHFMKLDGSTVTSNLTMPPLSRRTVNPKTIAGLEAAEFSTVVESNVALVVDRTMTWDSATHYGSHAETSVPAPALTWYLAEGATHSGFNLFYLLQNANSVSANVEVMYLLPAPSAPLVRNYVVPANSRFNIWVDLIPELANTDVSAIVNSTNGQPIIVGRAMYLDAQGLAFGAGHESAGVTAPATSWFLAEGATGPFFDLFVLIANPNPTDAAVTATYYLPSGHAFFKTYIVAANSRFNIWVDLEDPLLADTAVSVILSTTGGVPVIVERSMWWPGSAATWHEAHNSPGATEMSTKWALAEGEVGGPTALQTYILVAHPSAGPANVKVTLLLEDGGTLEKTYTLTGNSRFNVSVQDEFPEAVNRRFGAVVETLDGSQIVVERAMYSNANGVVWAAGTNATATPLP